MTDTRKAGTMILENLAMFNEAVVLYEKNVHIEIMEELDNTIIRWAEKEGWKGESDWQTDLDYETWIAPAEWNFGKEIEEDFKAWFTLAHLDEDATDSYIIADFCGVGETEIGFWFRVKHQFFGGKTQWNAFAKSISPEIAKQISLLGFLDQGKGSYFLPLHLQYKELASAWDNEDYANVFSPVTTALDTLKRSKSVFEELLTCAESYKFNSHSE